MTTRVLDLVTTDQSTDLQDSAEKEDEEVIHDDRNNNAQEKVLPKFPILKRENSFSKNDRQEVEDSPKVLQLNETSAVSDLRNDGLKAPTSKNWSLANDHKNFGLNPSDSKHSARNHDDVAGSSKNYPVLPPSTSESVRNESSGESEKGFSEYFSQSVGVPGSKTSSASDGTMKHEAKVVNEGAERSVVMATKPVSKTTAAEHMGPGHLSPMFEAENSSKNRQKGGTQVSSQAAPVKPRCTPAREAVDPAKYFTLTDEPDGTKYACSKCGNVYKWRKSLNKHWKEKHDGETPNLHARPPPSLLQRERFLSPIRGAPKHSNFHQPGYHGPSLHSKSSSAAAVISPPRLHHAMPSSKTAHGPSQYLFGKFPIKDEGREIGKTIHQVEEPVTAVVRPSRSNQSPVSLPRWNNWLSSASRPFLDFSSPQKLKIPLVESIKSAHGSTQSRNNHGRMFSAIQGHHTLRGGPLDLSGTLVSRSVSDDDNILDLSRKGSSNVFPSTFKGATPVQDEPLDFSIKSGNSKSLGHLKNMSTASSDSPLPPNWFRVADRKESSIPKAVDFSDIGAEGQKSMFSLNDFDNSSPAQCASCLLPCQTIAELNHHFARNHMNVVYEAAVDMSSGNHHRAGSAAQMSSNNNSTQLLKYLTWESAKKSLACIVCGMSVQWSWMLVKHFEQMHSSIQPNPYKKTSAISTSATTSSHLDSDTNPAPNHRCESCCFSTDSAAEFSRHQLKHSLAKEKKEQELPNSGCLQLPGDDQTKDSMLNCTSGSPFKQFTDGIIDLEDESTAIVIPQAPEETYLGCPSSGEYLNNNVASSDDSPSAFGKLSYEAGMVISGENTAIVIPQAPEETSLGSSSAYSTPSGSKGSRSKKDTGSSTESLLPFKCDLCEYRARWPSEMMQHMKNHSDEKPYQCPQCSYRSKWKWDVVKHLKRCGGGGSVKDVIDTTLKKKSYIKSLLADSHSHQSAYDDSHSYGSLNFSGYYEQSNSLKLRDSLSKGPPNITVYSGMNEMHDSPEGTENYENCDSEDTVSEDLSFSKSEQGNEPSQNNHGCPQCPFMGHSPAELKRHLRVHSDEKPYSCQTCNYSSKWKCDLKKHLKAYNHVSGVSLSYGGHGKKPMSWSQIARQMSCPGALGDDGKETELGDGDLRSLLQGGYHGKKGQGLDRPSSSDSGNLFGGITSGGRLKCKQCEFEAIDITSFLQHKKMHRKYQAAVKKRDGNTIKRRSPLPPYHHRRKSFKQTRVLPAATGKEFSERTERNLRITGVIEPEEFSLETKRFWESLGLQSISSMNHKRKSSGGESDENYDDPDSSDSELENDSVCYSSPSKRARYDSSENPGFMKQFSQASSNSYGSNSDTEIEHMEGTEFGDGQARTRTEMEMEGMEETEKLSDGKTKEMKVAGCYMIAKNPMQVVRRGLRQGVTTTEAEDAAGMSKRKRKLRTCEKCGYITDNLTTLQRHAAKHGSGGRHRCWKCDYSVDRQHVLEYHIKIVHEGAGRVVENKVEEWNCGPKVEKRNGDEKKSPESSPQKVERRLTFDRGSFGGKRKIVCTTSVITVRGHEMEMIQKGNKTWYNCIKCHFVSSNITNAVNHAKQHGANKKYKCKYCDYSLDRKSSIANHMNSQHSHSDAFQFDIEPEKGILQSSASRWKGELYRNDAQGRRFSLLDKMSIQWKKHTCVKCGFCSINPTWMLLHRLAHGRMDKEFGCDKCSYRFTSYRTLESHKKSHGSVKSTNCWCSINSVAMHHGNSSSSGQKVRCEKCSDVPRSPSSELSIDAAKATSKIGNSTLEREKAYKPSAKIQCPFCPFASFSALKSAIHSQHHFSLKKLACSKCSFRANVRNVLYHHQKLHC